MRDRTSLGVSLLGNWPYIFPPSRTCLAVLSLVIFSPINLLILCFHQEPQIEFPMPMRDRQRGSLERAHRGLLIYQPRTRLKFLIGFGGEMGRVQMFYFSLLVPLISKTLNSITQTKGFLSHDCSPLIDTQRSLNCSVGSSLSQT